MIELDFCPRQMVGCRPMYLDDTRGRMRMSCMVLPANEPLSMPGGVSIARCPHPTGLERANVQELWIIHFCPCSLSCNHG